MELGWKEKFMRYARQIFVIEFFILYAWSWNISYYAHKKTLMLVLFLSYVYVCLTLIFFIQVDILSLHETL